MAKYTYSINGQSSSSATKALKRLLTLRQAGVKVTVHVNNEPIMVSELRETAALETLERAHNKRQGL